MILKEKIKWNNSTLNLAGGNNRNCNTNIYVFLLFLSLSLSVVLMWRMACRWVAVHWTLRLARVLVWYFRPTSPTVSAASPSSTAPTPTSTFRPKPCPATHPLPATCEYSKDVLCIILTPANQPAFRLHAAFYIAGLLIWIRRLMFFPKKQLRTFW